MRAAILVMLLLAATPSAKKKPAPAPDTGWTIQVASTSSRAEAQRLVTLFIGRDAPAFWSETSVNGKPMFRVRVGHFRTKDEAKAFADSLSGEWKLDYWIAADEKPAAVTAPAVAATSGAITLSTATPAASATAPSVTAADPILAEAIAAHGGPAGGFTVLERAGAITLRYRLKSVDPKTGEPVFTRQTWRRKGENLRLDVEPMEGSGPSSVTIVAGDKAWVNAGGTITALKTPAARARIESLGPSGMLKLPLDFPRRGAGAANIGHMVVAGPKTLNGEPVLRLDAQPPPERFSEASLYVDPETHRLAAARFLTEAGELLVSFTDYRRLDPALIVPYRRSVYRDGVVVSSVEIDELTLDPTLDDLLFAK